MRPSKAAPGAVLAARTWNPGATAPAAARRCCRAGSRRCPPSAGAAPPPPDVVSESAGVGGGVGGTNRRGMARAALIGVDASPETPCSGIGRRKASKIVKQWLKNLQYNYYYYYFFYCLNFQR